MQTSLQCKAVSIAYSENLYL